MAKPEPFYIDVDLKKNTQYEVPSVTQMDTATFFIVRITDDGRMVPGLLDYFSTITMTSERPDRKSFYVLGKPVEGKENEILFHLGTDETALTGNVRASLQFYSVDGRNTSAQFRYNVDKDLSGEYVPSERESSLIETVLVQGPKIMAAAEKATADAIKAMNELTGAVSGALETLQTDKAAALKEMADATLKANTAADNADDERQQLTMEVSEKIEEVEAVRLSTVDVKDATQNVQDATKLVRQNTESERLLTKSERESTQLVRKSVEELVPTVETARDEANTAGEFAQEQGNYAKLQGDLQAEQMTDVAGVLEYVQDDFLPGIAESQALFEESIRNQVKDPEITEAHDSQIWGQTFDSLDTRLEFDEVKINEKANKQQEVWIKPTLINGVTEASPTSYPIGYYKDTIGRVHIRGALSNVPDQTIAFVLPVGYRPQTNAYVDGITVLGNGSVRIGKLTGTIYLDSTSFRAE